MRVRFTWQTKEWHEAVQLAIEPSRPRRDIPFMVYGVLGITCLGGVGDLFHFVEAQHIENAGRLLMMGSAFSTAAGGAVWLTRTGLRKRRSKRLPPAPEGEQEATFKESGWHIAESSETATIVLQPWSALNATRTGTHAMVMVGSAGTFTGLPLRAVSPDEAGYLKRLLARKVRPSVKDGPDPAMATAIA